MESTHTNTLESLDSRMDLGLVKRVAIVASDEVLSSQEGVVMMDFHVDNYNNLSRRIIAFLCIDSTQSNSAASSSTARYRVILSTRQVAVSVQLKHEIDRIHNMHNRLSFIIRHPLSSSSSHHRIVKTVVYIQIVPPHLSSPLFTSQSRPDF
jgi:hypothetical protein